jgi:hypothetical protein
MMEGIMLFSYGGLRRKEKYKKRKDLGNCGRKKENRRTD